ncbi:MAG: tetratricopeptide repeat protein [Acidobacteriota bacterium]
MKWLLVFAVVLTGCATAPPPAPPPPAPALPPRVEAVSLLGKQLSAPVLPPDIAKQREDELAAARRDYEKNPDDANAIIWLGRRTAYLGRYREAIAIFTEGIAKHPGDARMFRHRGHRYITIRDFGAAIRDLQRAAELVRGKPDEIEPDGLPNARNIPTTSLQSNIYYHLGLAHYLDNNYERALAAYEKSLALSTNADRLVSTMHWMWMTLRRLGRRADAEKLLDRLGTDMDVIENRAYHQLVMMYDGQIAVEELRKQDPATTDGATILYGVGNWYFVEGRPDDALPVWRQIVDGGQWAAFGTIAAEADMARRTR